MGGVRYGVFLWSDRPVPQMAEQVRLPEELGYDSAWVLDSQLVGRECYTTLAACALRTSRIRIGPGVTHFATRHPTVVASAFASLAELAPGRVQLAIGFGDSAIGGAGALQRTGAQAGLGQSRADARDGSVHCSWPQAERSAARG